MEKIGDAHPEPGKDLLAVDLVVGAELLHRAVGAMDEQADRRPVDDPDGTGASLPLVLTPHPPAR